MKSFLALGGFWQHGGGGLASSLRSNRVIIGKSSRFASSSSPATTQKEFREKLGLPEYKMDYFTLFGVNRELDPSKFEISKLQTEYRKFQSVYHPDQLHVFDATIQRLAEAAGGVGEGRRLTSELEDLLKDGSSYVGSGVATLKDPYRRARYIMHLINAEERHVERGWRSGEEVASPDDVALKISNENAFELTKTCDNAERDKGSSVADDRREEEEISQQLAASSSTSVAKAWAVATQGSASSSVRVDTDFLEEMFEFNVTLSDIKEKIEPATTVTAGSPKQEELRSLKEDVLVDDAALMEIAMTAFKAYAAERAVFGPKVAALLAKDEETQLIALTPYAEASSNFKIAVLKWTYTQNLLRGIREME